MFEESSFEELLAQVEQEAEAAARAAAALSRELKKARLAASTGQVRDLRRSLAAAATQAHDVATAVDDVAGAYDIDETELLASGAYRKELLAAAAEAGVAMFEEDERILCYPSLVRLIPADQAVEIDKRRERRLRPSFLLGLLERGQRAGPRFKPAPFLSSLLAAYDLVVAAQGKQAGAVVKLVDCHAVLTLLPGQAKDYSQQEFARDLYLLDQTGETSSTTGKRVRQLRWSASTGTRHPGVLTTVARSGQQQRYWGVSFADRPIAPEESRG